MSNPNIYILGQTITVLRIYEALFLICYFHKILTSELLYCVIYRSHQTKCKSIRPERKAMKIDDEAIAFSLR